MTLGATLDLQLRHMHVRTYLSRMSTACVTLLLFSVPLLFVTQNSELASNGRTTTELKLTAEI